MRQLLDTERISGRCALFWSLQLKVYMFQKSISNYFLSKNFFLVFLKFRIFRMYKVSRLRDTIMETQIQKNFGSKIFFRPKNFFKPTFFQTHIFFDLNFFPDQNFFLTKNNFWTHFFQTQNNVWREKTKLLNFKLSKLAKGKGFT